MENSNEIRIKKKYIESLKLYHYNYGSEGYSYDRNRNFDFPLKEFPFYLEEISKHFPNLELGSKYREEIISYDILKNTVKFYQTSHDYHRNTDDIEESLELEVNHRVVYRVFLSLFETSKKKAEREVIEELTLKKINKILKKGDYLSNRDLLIEK